MTSRRRELQRGQAIVLVGLLVLVLFGFVGIAIDGGRAYLERRGMQSAVDAASLAAAYKYMATNPPDIGQAEIAARDAYALNERLYVHPACTPVAGACSFSFGDPTNHVLVVTPVDHSIAGTTFTASASHQMTTTMMQVLGAAPRVVIGATATALARRVGVNGAAIQTLSESCSGSLTFGGNGSVNVVGDVWSNGNVSGGGSSSGSVVGNVVGVCSSPAPPFLPSPWTVSGSQVNGWNMEDPDYASPSLNSASPSWTSPGCDGECPGTYASQVHLVGGSGCYFLEGGVYDFTQGLVQDGGLVSNELRPPDEPNVYGAGIPNTTTLSRDFAAGRNVTSIAVSALPAAVPTGSGVFVGGQMYMLSASAAAGATSLSITRQDVPALVPSGSLVSFRANPQFWDSLGSPACGGSFAVDSTGNTNNLSGTWSIVVTAVRWEPYTCAGLAVATPSCFIRESAPSMCKTVTLASSTNIKVTAVTAVPGAEYLNIYAAANGSCSGLHYLTQVRNTANSQIVINSATFPAGWPTGFAVPPDYETPPQASNLPNSDPAPGTPPHGDLANEAQCVNPSTGANVACTGSMVNPGAVIFYLPSTGCISMNGGGDIYVFSGYQYQRVVVFEPGPEQSSQPNTCANRVNGHDFTSFIGIFYIPAADVTLNGTSRVRATIAGGLIAYTATVLGSENLAISADPSLRAWPATVRLTQ